MNSQRQRSYVLVTAAFNEEAHIGKTIEAVAGQTTRPVVWVIVSDRSTDRTDEIVREHAARIPWIKFVRQEESPNKGFGSKVSALAAGVRSLEGLEYSFVGHLDADVSFASDYFSRLLAKFAENPALGVAGGYVCDEHGGRLMARRYNSLSSVAGAVQLFRKECYEAIGGLLPLTHGGEDWHAEVTARMKGWQVRSFPDLMVLHHRPTGRAGGLLRNRYREGLMDFSVGTHPLFEIFKLGRRLSGAPPVLGALVRFLGFASSYATRRPRMVSDDFVMCLRREQMGRLRLRSLARSVFREQGS